MGRAVDRTLEQDKLGLVGRIRSAFLDLKRVVGPWGALFVPVPTPHLTHACNPHPLQFDLKRVVLLRTG
jgi:hypothetical protein